MGLRTLLSTATLALAVLAASSVHAASGEPVPRDAAVVAVDVQGACLDAAAAPPCGYIVPTISLDFDDKPICRSKTLGGPLDLTQCIPLPEVGGTYQIPGTFRFSWDITQDGTYPADPLQPIVITFSGTATNPKWVDLAIEPAEVTLAAQDLASPANMRVDEEQRVWFWYEQPLTVTFTREDVGADDKSVQRIDRAKGAVQVFLKAKSGSSGQYFKEAFGVEEFRFNPCANGDALSAAVDACYTESAGEEQLAAPEEAPAWGILAPIAVLGAAAWLARRRRA